MVFIFCVLLVPISTILEVASGFIINDISSRIDFFVISINCHYIFLIKVNITVIIVGEAYIRVIHRVIIIAVTMQIIVRIIIGDITVTCFNKRLNDIVFHYDLYLDISDLLVIKPSVGNFFFFFGSFMWVFKHLNKSIYKVELI